MSVIHELLTGALQYGGYGWSIIPVSGKKPPTGFKWRKCQQEPLSEKDLTKACSRPGISGLAVVLGKASGGLCCRDFDDYGAYQAWKQKHSEISDSLPTVKTARGFHVYFKWIWKGFKKLGDGELRGHGAYCVLPPSKHPDGPIYKWMIPLPDGEIPEIDPCQAGLVEGWTDKDIRNGIQIVQDNTESTENAAVRNKDRYRVFRDNKYEVCSVENAVRLALPSGIHQNHSRLFVLSRALKTFRIHMWDTGQLPADHDFKPLFLRNSFEQWHNASKPFLRPELTKEQYWEEFLDAWRNTNYPLGMTPLVEVLQKATQSAMPTVAKEVFPEYKDVQLLIAFCREMQREFEDFFLSCSDCSRLLRMPQTTVWRWLGRIEGLGIIRCLKKGKRGMSGKASTYRYLYPLDDGRQEEPPHLYESA